MNKFLCFLAIFLGIFLTFAIGIPLGFPPKAHIYEPNLIFAYLIVDLSFWIGISFVTVAYLESIIERKGK